MRATPVVLLATLAIAGCARRDDDIRIARAKAETKMLAASFDRLEERLLADQARVRLWQELKERHESVSAIACASQEEHAVAMAMHALPERSSLHQARVAAAAPGPVKPLVRSPEHRETGHP